MSSDFYKLNTIYKENTDSEGKLKTFEVMIWKYTNKQLHKWI